MKQIYLRQLLDPIKPGFYRYVCEKLVNSTFPAIDELLTKSAVDELCIDDEWKVTIL